MNDRLAPERLQKNQFALGKNLETRYGGARSRRGSWLVNRDHEISSNNYAEVTGAGVYESVTSGERNSLVYSAYSASDDETYFYRIGYPFSGTRSLMTLPTPMVGEQKVRFVQAYDYIYALRDGGEPLRWSGEVSTSTWEVVPNGTSGAMPTGREGLYAYNRLWLIEGDDTIIASDLLSANWDRINNEFRVEQGDGTRLVALRPFSNGNLIAFKERGIAVISGANNFTTTSDMTMQFIDDRIGCIAPDTAVAIGKDVFFLGREGVWTIQQTSEQNAQLVELPLSEPIWGLMQDISWQYADRFSAASYDNYYLLAVAVDGNEYPNRVLAYDLLSRSWVGYWEYEGGPYQQKDDSDRFEHSRLILSDDENIDSLLSLGRAGAVASLLKGDTQDMIDTGDRQARGYAIFHVTGGNSLDLSEFTDGYISIEGYTYNTNADSSLIWTGSSGSLTLPNWPSASNTSPTDSLGAKQTQYVWCWADFVPASRSATITFEIGSSTADIVEWRGTFVSPNAIDREPHDYLFYHDGSELRVFVDEVELSVTFEAASATCLDNRSVWLDSLVHDFAVGCGASNSENQPWKKVAVYTDYKTSAPHTTEVERVEYIAASVENLDTTLTRYTMVDGDYTETSIDFTDGDSFSTVNGNSAKTIYTNTGTVIPSPVVDVESQLKTRGFTHGGELVQKGGYRGELRFEHGQPSVTAVMSSDKPFDTETLASLNAKTYSLTAYDIHNKTAWVQDNSNDDFATPFREDYAPIALNGAGSGVAIGTNGLDLDIYAEHTELFTSLAIAGWVQFTLTNTQGYVRYNNLQIEANNRSLEQDGGNQ
jgi:hypothetical protein